MLTYLNLDEILEDDIKLSESNFICKIKEQNSYVLKQLSENNLKDIYAKIQDKSYGDFSDLDFIKILTIKLLYPILYENKYKELFLNNFNLYIGDIGYTFDPAKNGQNIIKHEVSFMRIMESLTSVYIFEIDKENRNNTDRIMITTHEGHPYLSVCSRDLIGCKSIIRLISSTKMSLTNDKKNIKRIWKALNEHYDKPPTKEIIQCIWTRIKQHLAIQHNTNNESSAQ